MDAVDWFFLGMATGIVLTLLRVAWLIQYRSFRCRSCERRIARNIAAGLANKYEE